MLLVEFDLTKNKNMQIINNNIECETNVEFIVECMAAH
jgi:hypothetical protein